MDDVRLMIGRGADIEQRDDRSRTPFYYACQRGRIETAKLLLERGCEVDRPDSNGWTALLSACNWGHLDAVILCLEGGAAYNDRSTGGWTPLGLARHHRHAVMAALLARIHKAGSWTRYISEPRYKLVVLRELTARGWARRERAFNGKEPLLDLLFPGGRPNTRAKRDQPRLPDDVFSVIVGGRVGGRRPSRRPPSRPPAGHTTASV